MSVDISQFSSFFQAVYEKPPFPWQIRLANQVYSKGWPACIDLPSASGKTSVIDIAVFVLACQAGAETTVGKVGRRVFFVVNRRVLVDEAYQRAVKLAKKLLAPTEGILQRVAWALRSINADINADVNADRGAPPLDVAQLRGGIYGDRRWARGITQPMIVATTADQLGSRMLFRGYGVSPAMQPIHAALTACDSLIFLDQAHATRAFAQTLHAISKYRKNETAVPLMRFVEMTATPADDMRAADMRAADKRAADMRAADMRVGDMRVGDMRVGDMRVGDMRVGDMRVGDLRADDRFVLDDADRAHPVLAARQTASKPIELVDLGKARGEQYVGLIADRAIHALSDDRKAIGVMVNRVRRARDIYSALRQRLEDGGEADIYLAIGRMRPLDRDRLTEKLRTVLGPDRPDRLTRPCLVVATQCLEVGADYDFDALISECASVDALRQRFGRLNRQGRRLSDHQPFPTIGAIVASDALLQVRDPVYGCALRNTWKWLTDGGRTSIDFGIRAFELTWKSVEANPQKYLDSSQETSLLAPAPDAAILLPAHLDALCQTAPPAEPSPDVSHFIQGPKRDDTDVQVCWRADLGSSAADWEQIISMLPPTSPECMSVPIRTFRKWLGIPLIQNPDADVNAPSIEDAPSGSFDKEFLIWRGSKDILTTTNPALVRPGDTIVVPVSRGGWNELGYIPGNHIDIAEVATAQARRQRVIRVHADLPHGNIAPELFRYATHGAESLSNAAIGELLGTNDRFKQLSYPPVDGVRPGILLRFKPAVADPDPLVPSTINEEDDDDSASQIGQRVSLAQHSEDVVRAVDRVLERLELSPFEPLIRLAARLHDLGKADVRFQAWLLGCTPVEAAMRPVLLGKSGQRDLSLRERIWEREQSRLPAGFRHEMLSVQMIENAGTTLVNESIDLGLLLHVVGSHHGHGRPSAPISINQDVPDDWLEVWVDGLSVSARARREFVPSHWIGSGIAERFWKFTRVHGWWGLAYLESVLRLADQQATEDEQNRQGSK